MTNYPRELTFHPFYMVFPSAPFIIDYVGGYHHPVTRQWQAERHLTKVLPARLRYILTKQGSLMYPIFITDKPDAEEDITSLPLQKR
jgi:hypothetical protein